jgi:hypothetical protein
MEDRLDQVVEAKKEWLLPELKKIDVEKLTAANVAGDDDSTSFS